MIERRKSMWGPVERRVAHGPGVTYANRPRKGEGAVPGGKYGTIASDPLGGFEEGDAKPKSDRVKQTGDKTCYLNASVFRCSELEKEIRGRSRPKRIRGAQRVAKEARAHRGEKRV